jgi:cysteine synthase
MPSENGVQHKYNFTTFYTHIHINVYDKIILKLFDIFQLKEGGYQQLVSSSGGNAGVAAAYASWTIDIPCTVYVPEWIQPAHIELIKDNGAQVRVNTFICLTKTAVYVLPGE